LFLGRKGVRKCKERKKGTNFTLTETIEGVGPPKQSAGLDTLSIARMHVGAMNRPALFQKEKMNKPTNTKKQTTVHPKQKCRSVSPKLKKDGKTEKRPLIKENRKDLQSQKPHLKQKSAELSKKPSERRNAGRISPWKRPKISHREFARQEAKGIK